MPIRKLTVMITALFLLSTAAWAVTKVPATAALEVTTPLTVFYGEAIDGTAQVTASDGSAVTGTVTFAAGVHVFTAVHVRRDVAGASSGASTSGEGAAGGGLRRDGDGDDDRCGTGTCTDLGTRPGTYTITVTGSVGGTVVSQKVKLVVAP